MSKATCKCKETECEECPEWIFTLADLIMCMMGLFVILWVLKPEGRSKAAVENNPELVKVLAGIREGFGYNPDPNSKDPIDLEILARRIAKLRGAGQGGSTNVPPQGAQGDEHEVQGIRMGKESLVGGRVLFDAGSATITVEGRRTLDQIVSLIKGHKNVMLIKGHASRDEFAEGVEPQAKLDLSIRRAQAVADYLVAQGVEPEILRVVGCSTFEPVKQRAYSPEEKQLNRRTEVESISTLVGEFQDRPATRPVENDDERGGRSGGH